MHRERRSARDRESLASISTSHPIVQASSAMTAGPTETGVSEDVLCNTMCVSSKQPIRLNGVHLHLVDRSCCVKITITIPGVGPVCQRDRCLTDLGYHWCQSNCCVHLHCHSYVSSFCCPKPTWPSLTHLRGAFFSFCTCTDGWCMCSTEQRFIHMNIESRCCPYSLSTFQLRAPGDSTVVSEMLQL